MSKDRPAISSAPEHVKMATEFAHVISERFNPDEQNEMLKHIYNLLKELRLAQIADFEARCKFLHESIKGLEL